MSIFTKVTGTLVIIFFSFFSCVKGQQAKSFDALLHSLLSETVPQITVDSLHVLQNNNPSIKILDTRELEEFRISHIPNANYVGYKNFNLEDVRLNKLDTIVVYCSVGYRSGKIGEQLIRAGYKNVLNLRGGIFGWANKGYPMVNITGTTKKVHGYSKTWGVWLNDKSNVVYE